MDSVNSFKGYGKVDEGEERTFRQKTRRRLIIAGVSAILLVAVIIVAVILATFIHNNNNPSSQSQSPQSQSPQSSSSSIKAICSVTQYPDSCFSSLSSSLLLDSNQKAAAVDPQQLFKLSMQIAVNELSKLSSLPDKLIPTIDDDPLVKAALQNCKDLFEDSIDELNSSMELVNQNQQLSSSSIKIEDIKTWVSTAITNQETCLDGLDETQKSDLLSQMKNAMKNSTEFSSNSLAIVAKIIKVIDDLSLPPPNNHNRRKLLGRRRQFPFPFPMWVNSADRRRLLDEEAMSPDVTVAIDGSGNYKSIGEAVAAVGKKNKTRTVIYVKQGTYAENVVVDKAHWNIMMYGDGMTKTIVSGNLNFIDGTPTFSTATFSKYRSSLPLGYFEWNGNMEWTLNLIIIHPCAIAIW
ncbi:Pectinesterase [Thalictrum thalictroides]|uniref:Pectinesterase n=1 Tax=Thalictrum thalictroides TaxID=46969 RepID=A0A7J6WQB3_THATH|nr:Pectinesterase [Thalictrum thalictroides]